jgi:UPF0042 nucleotide-binding protein
MQAVVHALIEYPILTLFVVIGLGYLLGEINFFGFKFGVPHDVDLIFDVRFLANPHFVPELKPKTGSDPAVAAYIEKDPETSEFLGRLTEFLDYLLPRYEREDKSYLSIGIGCTGGRHRSVYVAERLAALLNERGYPVRVSHRDARRGD